MPGFGIAAEALRNRNILVAEFGFAGFSIVEGGTWLALLLYAFDRGGVGEAGIVASVLLIPAAVLAPFGAAAIDRLQPNRALAAGFGPQAIGCVTIAFATAVDASFIVVYGLAALFTAAMSLSRPTLSAALPAISRTPAELAAANSVAGFIETAGAFAGPAAAGVILLAADTAAVFALSAAVLLAATALALTIDDRFTTPGAAVSATGVNETGLNDTGLDAKTTGGRATESDGGGEGPQPVMMADEPETLRVQLLAGFALLRSQPEPRLLVAMMALTWMVFGALDVAMVVIAVDQLGRGEGTAGLLGSAVGFGGLVGAIVSVNLVGQRRHSIPVVAGLLGVGLPVMALAANDSLVLVVLLLTIVGFADIIADVAGRTLIQGLAAEDTLARVFGILEGLGTAALAVGSIGFSLLAVAAGVEIALLAVGALIPLLLLLRVGKLLEIDRARPEVDPELLSILRQVPIFAPLPAFRVEQMLLNLGQVRMAPGQLVFSKGDYGDLLYVVADGVAEVELPDRIAVHHPGGFFGEIALLHDQPRLATVRAGDKGLMAYTLDREVFLQALNDFPRSQRRTAREAQRRLEENERRLEEN